MDKDAAAFHEFANTADARREGAKFRRKLARECLNQTETELARYDAAALLLKRLLLSRTSYLGMSDSGSRKYPYVFLVRGLKIGSSEDLEGNVVLCVDGFWPTELLCSPPPFLQVSPFSPPPGDQRFAEFRNVRRGQCKTCGAGEQPVVGCYWKDFRLLSTFYTTDTWHLQVSVLCMQCSALTHIADRHEDAPFPDLLHMSCESAPAA